MQELCAIYKNKQAVCECTKGHIHIYHISNMWNKIVQWEYNQSDVDGQAYMY